MNLSAKWNLILMLIFYIGFIAASLYGIFVTFDYYEFHDINHVKKLNCTCSPDDTHFQCVSEAIRMARSTYKIECNKIEKPGQPPEYSFCYCAVQSKHHCRKMNCHKIDKPLSANDIPERCVDEICKTCGELKIYIFAAIMGTAFGITAVVAFCFAFRNTVKNPTERVDFSRFHWIHIFALVPPAMVGLSLLATDVRIHYSDLRMNTWAYWMLFGFGTPLLVVWAYMIRYKYLEHRGTHNGTAI